MVQWMGGGEFFHKETLRELLVALECFFHQSLEMFLHQSLEMLIRNERVQLVVAAGDDCGEVIGDLDCTRTRKWRILSVCGFVICVCVCV